VKLLDTNLLVYAYDRGSPHHEQARAWLESSLGARETVAFTWQTLLGFLRLTTSARIMAHPRPAAEVLDLIDDWLALPISTLLHPTRRHTPVLRDLLARGTAGNLVPDAHLAALAIEHGAVL